MHIQRKDPVVKRLIRAAFPAYRGRQIQITALDEFQVTNERSGGTWTDVFAVRLEDLAVLALTDFTTTRHQDQMVTEADLPDGVVLVAHHRFCGKDLGIEILVKPSNLAPALDDGAAELSDDERTVLGLHCRYTSAYRRECLDRAGIVGGRAETAYQSLISKGLLTRGRAIKPAGRNAWAKVAG